MSYHDQDGGNTENQEYNQNQNSENGDFQNPLTVMYTGSQFSIMSNDNDPGDQFGLQIIDQEGNEYSTMSTFGSEDADGNVSAIIDLGQLFPMGGAPELTDPTSLTYPITAIASFEGESIEYQVNQGELDSDTGTISYDVVPNLGSMGMPVFSLAENELGGHPAGYYTIMLEGPEDGPPDNFSLNEVVPGDAGGEYVDDGNIPLSGDPSKLSDAQQLLMDSSDPDTSTAVGTFSPSDHDSYDSDGSGSSYGSSDGSGSSYGSSDGSGSSYGSGYGSSYGSSDGSGSSYGSGSSSVDEYNEAPYVVYETLLEDVSYSASDTLVIPWDEMIENYEEGDESIYLDAAPDLNYLIMAGVQVTQGDDELYTMLYSASKYDPNTEMTLATPELVEAIVGTDQNDYDLSHFDDYMESSDNHVYVTNDGDDHLNFNNGGYKVAFMGDGNDELYIHTYTYGANNLYYADMGDHVPETESGRGGDELTIDHFWDGTATVGLIDQVSESTFIVNNNYGEEELRISMYSGAVIVEQAEYIYNEDSVEVNWTPVGEFSNLEEMHIGNMGGYHSSSDSSEINWSLLSFADNGSVEIVQPIDAFEYYTYIEDGDELEVGELDYSSWIGNQYGLSSLFEDGGLAAHGILINADSSEASIGTMTLDPGTIMFPSHDTVSIATYASPENGIDEIELTGTFGDDYFIAGSGDNVDYNMNWSPGTDVFVGGIDQYGRPNADINFGNWYEHGQQLDQIAYDLPISSDYIVYHQTIEVGTINRDDVYISDYSSPSDTMKDTARDILEAFSGSTIQLIGEFSTTANQVFEAGTTWHGFDSYHSYMLIDGSDGFDGEYELNQNTIGELQENVYSGVGFNQATINDIPSSVADPINVAELNLMEFSIRAPNMDPGDTDLGIVLDGTANPNNTVDHSLDLQSSGQLIDFMLMGMDFDADLMQMPDSATLKTYHMELADFETYVLNAEPTTPFDSTMGLVLDASSGTLVADTDFGSLTASNVYRISGTSGDDTITMGDGDNAISSEGGDDTFTGGLGLDGFYDLGFENTVTITDYEALERITWELDYDNRDTPIDTSDLPGMFDLTGNVLSFSDDSGYAGEVVLGTSATHSDFSIATIVSRYNDWEVEVTLNDGSVTDGYFHLNDDYTKVVLLDGHGITRGSIDEPLGVTLDNWEEAVTVEYDSSTGFTSISIDTGENGIVADDIVEIQGNWLLSPDEYGDINLIDLDNIQNVLNNAVSIENNNIDFEYGEIPVQQIFSDNLGFVLNDTDSTISINGEDVAPYSVVNPNGTTYSYATEVDSGQIGRGHFESSTGDDYVVAGSGDDHAMMFFWSPGNDVFDTPVDGENNTYGDGDLSFQSYSNYLAYEGISSDQHGIEIAMDSDGTLTFTPPSDLNLGNHSLSYSNVTDIWGTRGDDTITGDEFRNFLNPGDGGDNTLSGGGNEDYFAIHANAWEEEGSGLTATITDYQNYERIEFDNDFGFSADNLGSYVNTAYNQQAGSTSISVTGAGDGVHFDDDLPADGNYNDIITLEGGNFEVASILLKDHGTVVVQLETDTQTSEPWADYWIGDNYISVLITDYENNDEAITLDNDFGFSQDFASEVTWSYDAGREQTIISINTDSHNLGEVIFINGEVELEITDDATDGSNMQINKVLHSLDPDHERLGWNKDDDPDTPWDESFFPRYSDDHSPVNTPVNLGDDVDDPFRTIFKADLENNSHYAKDENGWLNEWMAARQTVSEAEGYFVGDLDSALTAADGTDGRDYYIIHGGDDLVVSTAGSDEFDIGFDAAEGQYSTGIVYNAIYDNGVIVQNHEDYAKDLDVISFQTMPEGVLVDVNAGAAYHTYPGAGGQTYTTEFAGIELYELSDYDDTFAGGGGLDVNWIDPAAGNDIIMGDSDVYTVLDYIRWEPEGIVVWNRGDLEDGIPFETLHEYTISGDNPDTDTNEGHAHSNGWLPIDSDIVGSDGLITIENAATFDGVVLDSSGFVDRYTNVDYFIGSQMPDIFLGGDEDETFNPLRADNGVDYVDGGDGVDTIIIEDARWGRGVWEPIADEVRNEGWFDVDFDSVIISRSDPSGDADDHFKIKGEDQDDLTDWYQINTTLNNVERIDLREYDDVDPAAGSQDTEVYVIDSYEYLAYGQGDLGNMFYVTSLHHGEHDIHEVEVVSGEVLDNENLAGSADIFYHGHHSDFDRTADVTNWVATAVSATAAAASTNGNLQWQGHESMFFAWYDHDGAGDNEAAYEIAVKYKDGEWRIENKVFDTFQDIQLSDLSPEDLAALNAKSGAIDAGKHDPFDGTMSLRIKMAAAYDDITNIITSSADVDDWDFDQAKTTSRSTFYVDIPNGIGTDGEWDGTMQQVKVDRVDTDEDGVADAWALDLDAQVLIKLPDVGNTLATSDIVAGGNAAENITAGVGSDTMLGGGGADTYTIQAGDASSEGPADAFGIIGDVINEIGGDLSSAAGDSVALAGLKGANAIDSVSFERTAIRFEDDEATLRMTTTNENGLSDVVHIFDHYNEDLPFRQVEQLLLDEGWEDDQIWNLVSGTSGENGDILTGEAYRDVLVGGSGDDVLTSGGGIDVMQGGAGSDTFVLGASDYAGDVAGAHGNVTMIRDYMASGDEADEIDLSALGITADDVSVEESGGHSYLVNSSDEDNPVVLAELTNTILEEEDTLNFAALTG